MAIAYGVFQKRLYLNQGPEKKGVSDEFFFIFLNPDLHSLAKKNYARNVCFSVQPLQGLSGITLCFKQVSLKELFPTTHGFKDRFFPSPPLTELKK